MLTLAESLVHAHESRAHTLSSCFCSDRFADAKLIHIVQY